MVQILFNSYVLSNIIIEIKIMVLISNKKNVIDFIFAYGNSIWKQVSFSNLMDGFFSMSCSYNFNLFING